MTRIVIPRGSCCSAKLVESTDFELYFCPILPTYAECGFTLSTPCPSSLSVCVASGTARFLGLHLCNTATCNVACLAACSTNFVYATVTRDAMCKVASWAFTTNTTGCLPLLSFRIGTATTSACDTTSVTTCIVPRTINVGEVATCIQVYPHSTTLADYVSPISTLASSCMCPLDFSDCFCTYCTQCAACAVWPSSDIAAPNFYKVDIACCNDVIFGRVCRDTTNDQIVHDVGIVGSEWTLRFKMRFCCMNYGTGGPFWHMGLSDSDETVGNNCVQNFVGMAQCIRTGCACMNYRAVSGDGIKISDTTGSPCPTSFNPTLCFNYYYEIKRLCATTATSEVFTCASFCMSIGLNTDTSLTACLSGLRYIKISTFNNGTPSAGHIQIKIDCLCFTSPESARITDQLNATNWSSNCEANPNVVLGTCCADMVGLMIRPRCTTTVTELKIRTNSTNMCFTDCDNVRRIRVADLTDCADNFIRFNRKSPCNDFVQIFGNDTTNKVMDLSEVRVLSPTDVTRRHGHLTIDSCDSSLALDGTQQ